MAPTHNPVQGRQSHSGKLLNRKAGSAVLKAVGTKNATHSPLLSLPPEIRNRIYGFVFGHDTIRVRARMYCRCGQKQPPQPRSILGLLRDRVQAVVTGHSHVFEVCEIGLEQKVWLDLLQVCRHIHREAALLPLQTLTIDFDKVHVFNTFLKGILPAQKRALKTMSININRQWDHLNRPWDRSYHDRARRLHVSIIKQLTGLHELEIIINAQDYERFRRTELRRAQSVVSAASLKRIEGIYIVGIMCLERCPLKKVSMTFDNTKWFVENDYVSRSTPRLTEEEKLNWAAEVQARMLKPWEEVVYQVEAKTTRAMSKAALQ